MVVPANDLDVCLIDVSQPWFRHEGMRGAAFIVFHRDVTRRDIKILKTHNKLAEQKEESFLSSDYC